MGPEEPFYWFFTIATTLAFFTVLFKLEWHKSWTGRWFFVLVSDFLVISYFVLAVRQQWISAEALPYFRAFVWGSVGVIMTWLTLQIWIKNPKFWIWSK